MGIEFSYAAETAFVSPLLLKIGVKHSRMTLVWALSPLVGFFLCPFMGSLSDRCRSKMGRRRPFIILLSIGVLLGLLLVPNGELLGLKFGDTPDTVLAGNFTTIDPVTGFEEQVLETQPGNHAWGIFFTIIGTVLLDFDADVSGKMGNLITCHIYKLLFHLPFQACQSPARAYLLDVTVPEDNAKGLSTFTIMAGLGGFMGYSLGAIDWDTTFIGEFFGGHVRAVFSLITVIFFFCVLATVTSFSEIPLPLLEELNQEQEDLNIPPRTSSIKRHSEAMPMTKDSLPLDSTNYGALGTTSTASARVRIISMELQITSLKQCSYNPPLCN